MKIIIGIDVGLDGGIATLLDTGSEIRARAIAMPTITNGTKRRYDMTAIRKLIFDTYPNLVAIEKQQAMPKQGGVSMFSLGEGFGILTGIVTGLGFAMMHVPPKVWQKEAHCGISGDSTKAKSIIAAQNLFPDLSLLATPKCTKPHDGMADALLLAWWALRNRDGDK